MVSFILACSGYLLIVAIVLWSNTYKSYMPNNVGPWWLYVATGLASLAAAGLMWAGEDKFYATFAGAYGLIHLVVAVVRLIMTPSEWGGRRTSGSV